MNSRKHFLFSIFILSLLLVNYGCAKKTNSSQTLPQKEEQGFVKATVKNYTVDGCTWILVLDNEKKLQPDKLDAAFQKNNLPVWIKYETRKNAVSICMSGEPVTIIAMKLRKQ